VVEVTVCAVPVEAHIIQLSVSLRPIPTYFVSALELSDRQTHLPSSSDDEISAC